MKPVSLLSLLLMLPTSFAQTPSPFPPPQSWARGAMDTTYAEWDFCTTPVGPNAPDVGSNNTFGMPTLANLEPSAFLTGTGNIYSPAAPIDLEITVPAPPAVGLVTTVVLQARALGAELDYTSPLVNGVAPTYGGLFDRQMLMSPGGLQIDTYWLFELPDSPSTLTITFQGSGPHVSLDRVVVDTFTGAAHANETPPPSCAFGTTCGDCNEDGSMDILDALQAAQHAAGVLTLSARGQTACNVTGTLAPDPGAAVDILDALMLAQAAAGLPVTLACC